MRLSQVVGIGGSAIADHLAENLRASPAGTLEGFQSHDCRAFAQGKAIARGVKWAAFCGREGLQRIEAGKNKLAQGVVTAGQNSLGLSGSNQVEGMAQGIGS